MQQIRTITNYTGSTANAEVYEIYEKLLTGHQQTENDEVADGDEVLAKMRAKYKRRPQ